MPSSMLMRYRPPLTGLESHLSGLDVLRKKDFDHKTELHKSRLKNMKPMIDNKPPATTNMKHLQFNRKKREMDFQRYSAIEKENFRLLDKMSRIMVRNAADSVFGEHTNLNCPALDGERARKRRNDKLIEQNQLIGRRLREAKPYYSLAEWDKHTNRTHSLMSHICKYPNQVFPARDSFHSLTAKDSHDELDVGKESLRSRVSEMSSGSGHTKVLRRRPLPSLNSHKGPRNRNGAESAPPILDGG
uniref:Cilia- and flagella-associated protein 97 n=3 Tax=Guillardia theta TaxID=55529 RepID=A0A7S4PLI0_GUITH|mmetsp:Transcript_6337/g.22581  ORF Transcript_6337/g.22581 Transcript_6337/m.22581 type:complete len:245 (+) Transcript_6337:248-982(+)